MADSLNVQMHKYNGTDFDNLYPSTTPNQIIGQIPADKISGEFTIDQITGDIPVSKLTGTLPVEKGGTGTTTLTDSELVVAHGTSPFTTISAQALRNNMGLGNTTGALPVANGGTGVGSLAAGQIVMGNNTNSLYTVTAQSLRNTMGLGNTTGVLPVANGGIGTNTLNVGQVVIGNGQNALYTQSYQAVRNSMGLGNTLGLLPVANGGTGVNSYQALANQLSPYISGGGKWELKLEADFMVGPSGSGASKQYNYNIPNFCPVGSRVIICCYSRDGYQTGYSQDYFATVSITKTYNYNAIFLTSSEPTTNDGVCENWCVADFTGYASGNYFGGLVGYSNIKNQSMIKDTAATASGINVTVERSRFSGSGGNHILMKVFQYS